MFQVEATPEVVASRRNTPRNKATILLMFITNTEVHGGLVRRFRLVTSEIAALPDDLSQRHLQEKGLVVMGRVRHEEGQRRSNFEPCYE